MPVDEKTLVKTMELPAGQDWEWFSDANIIAVSSHLDLCGRARAMAEAVRFSQRREPVAPEPNFTVPLQSIRSFWPLG